jgi:hypothetical protein
MSDPMLNDDTHRRKLALLLLESLRDNGGVLVVRNAGLCFNTFFSRFWHHVISIVGHHSWRLSAYEHHRHEHLPRRTKKNLTLATAADFINEMHFQVLFINCMSCVFSSLYFQRAAALAC